MEEQEVLVFLGGRAWKTKLTVFGHLSDDVGHFGGAGGLGAEQGGQQEEDAHLLDLHTGLGVCRRNKEKSCPWKVWQSRQLSTPSVALSVDASFSFSRASVKLLQEHNEQHKQPVMPD
ncbi:hypothetical protein EYF80_038983 [Liparis tanakae]|uniref:Uncharacterized protein n=1 Tax=Liparis tanakae TaxID=230148 RepID=A0A4Z2GB66_9TELE|nr:hypothetical protein EYF80_038983 [Liparis tanakae]